jgi:[protein-PII] uridylyltransferase
MPAHACLVAVGGFGRGALFPYSDIDVLVLLPTHVAVDDDATLKSKVEQFIGSCWDAGLEIGSSVRNLTECLSEPRWSRMDAVGQETIRREVDDVMRKIAN